LMRPRSEMGVAFPFYKCLRELTLSLHWEMLLILKIG
jgi:hypothetical protein